MFCTPSAVLVAVVLLTGCGRLGGEAFQPTNSRVLQLDDSQRLGQSFRPASERVAGVDLLTASFTRPPDPQGVLHVSLTDGVGGSQLARTSVPGHAVRDNAWLAVRFDEPVRVGEQAAFEVRWAGGAPLGLYVNVPPDLTPGQPPGQAPTPSAAPANDPYAGGELLINGQRAPGDLAFRVVNASRPAELAAAMSGLLRETGARLLERPWFAGVWVALIVAAAGVGIVGLLGAQLGQRGPGQQRAEDQEAAEQDAQYLPR
jgi:hypothetical protein